MDFLYPHAKILIFAKSPLPGKAKTRLIPALGEKGAALLAEKLIVHTVQTVTEKALCPVELWCTPSMEHRLFRSIEQAYSIACRLQQGEDLGERMKHAITASLTEAQAVIVIGTDCPVMDVEYLQQALDTLTQEQALVISPAEDGGYALLGMRDAVVDIFNNISWGSARVMEQTRDKLMVLQQDWYELPGVWDIDIAEDVQRAQKQGLLEGFDISAD